MSRFFDNVGAALVGYLAASLAAGFSYTLLLAAAIQITGSIAEPSELSAMQQVGGLVWFSVIASTFALMFALIPSIPVIILLAVTQRTDIFSYIVAGIAIGVSAIWIISRNVPYFGGLEVDWLVVCAGAFAGAAYWAVFRKMTLSKRQTA